MEEMKKNNDLMSGKGEGGKWITVNGSHIFIEDGQSVEDAMNKHFDKKKQASNPTPKKELSTTQSMKQKLKENNIDTKQISIRERNGGYSTSYSVNIKSPYIDKTEVERHVNNFESYERDERTGEILEGGNTYVFTQYEDGVFDEVSKQHLDDANKYIEQAKALPNEYSGVRIQDGVTLFRDGNTYEISVQNSKQWLRKRVYDAEGLSQKLFQLKQFGKIVQ